MNQVKPTTDEQPVLYLKLSPSTMQYQKVTKLANRLGCKWQDVVRIAIDNLVDNFPPDVKKSN